jgi:hypothetical protein
MGLQRFRAHCPRDAIWQDPAAPYSGVLFVRPTAHRAPDGPSHSLLRKFPATAQLKTPTRKSWYANSAHLMPSSRRNSY